MENHLTTMKEVFTELENIKYNIVWYRVYNTMATVQLCYLDRKKYYLSGKPRVYTFGTLNLLNFLAGVGNWNIVYYCKLKLHLKPN